MSKESSLPFFVYGTLREGYGNARWAIPEDAVFYPATMRRAALHYVSGHGGYPVLVDTDNDRDVVIGEVVWLDVLDERTRSMTDMELGAGYKMFPRLARIEDEDYPDPKDPMDPPEPYAKDGYVGALTFVYPADRRKGDRIESGDWTNP